MASVSKAGEPDLAGTETDPETEDDTPASQLREFNAGVVFVIDSTISMGPYIERTREAVSKILDRIEAANLEEQVKFGLVSYRDSVEKCQSSNTSVVCMPTQWKCKAGKT